uniref:Uncharacterized protein n=1 Tax=Trieres chinensis TaxID=1514140 RepID=A0A7S2A935_TRICV
MNGIYRIVVARPRNGRPVYRMETEDDIDTTKTGCNGCIIPYIDSPGGATMWYDSSRNRWVLYADHKSRDDDVWSYAGADDVMWDNSKSPALRSLRGTPTPLGPWIGGASVGLP